jgi:hypothetical protein
MLLPNLFSFTLLSRDDVEALALPKPPARARVPAVPPAPEKAKPVRIRRQERVDAGKRTFLKLAAVAGAGFLATTVLPKQASAYVMGSTPAAGTVGVKNAGNVRVNPATEETLAGLAKGQEVLKHTASLSSSGAALAPVSGKKLRVYSTRFSMTADLDSVSFRFGAGGSDHELYLSPKTGGLYGSNNHPNFVEGGVDQPLYCAIAGTGSVQVNIDYAEV